MLLDTGVYGPLNEKQIDAVKRIEKNEKDLLTIINEMLGFVNSEKEPVASECRDLQLAEVFDAVEPLIAPDVKRKHLVVERELAQPDLTVWADPKQLQQILESLLSNAAKYTGDGGTITLGADADGGKVRIWVRDTGIGIKRKRCSGCSNRSSRPTVARHVSTRVSASA